MPRAYTTRAGQQLFKPTFDEAQRATTDDANGWCLKCGTVSGPTEPDASYQRCTSCSKNFVFGFSTLLAKNLIAP